MDKVPFVPLNPCSNFIFIVYVSKSIVKKYDNPPYYYSITNIHQKALAFLQMIPLLNRKNNNICMKYDGRASTINRIAYSKLNRTVKKHSD